MVHDTRKDAVIRDLARTGHGVTVTAKEDDRHSVDDFELKHFEVVKTRTGLAERWLDGPRHEVVARRMPHDSPVTVGTVICSSGDEHVPAWLTGESEHPWVAPRLIPVHPERLVPGGVRDDESIGRNLLPHE